MYSQGKQIPPKLVTALKEAHEVFQDCHLKGWSISFTQHREYYGICFKEIKEVRFSAPWFLVFTPEQRMNVIIHEAAHAIVGTHRQHGPSWIRKCQELGLADPLKQFHVSPELTQKALTWSGLCEHGCPHYRYRLNDQHHYNCGLCSESGRIQWTRNPKPLVPEPLKI